MRAVHGITAPASGANAAERVAKSPRHAEWVAIKVGATDSVMAWVVYPERRDKAPVVIAIHENTGINTWTRGVADQLAGDGFIGIAPDHTTMFRTGDLKADPMQDAGRAAIGQVTRDRQSYHRRCRGLRHVTSRGAEEIRHRRLLLGRRAIVQPRNSFAVARRVGGLLEGAGHGFLRGQDGSAANAAAAQQAWPKTVAFFRAKLGS